jgi:hypothetical protein
MADIAESDDIAPKQVERLNELENQDNPFPQIDYTDFRERQGSAA